MHRFAHCSIISFFNVSKRKKVEKRKKEKKLHLVPDADHFQAMNFLSNVDLHTRAVLVVWLQWTSDKCLQHCATGRGFASTTATLNVFVRECAGDSVSELHGHHAQRSHVAHGYDQRRRGRPDAPTAPAAATRSRRQAFHRHLALEVRWERSRALSTAGFCVKPNVPRPPLGTGFLSLQSATLLKRACRRVKSHSQ